MVGEVMVYISPYSGPATSGMVSVSMDVIGKPLLKELHEILSELGNNMPPELAQQISTKMGELMQENIDIGGSPPWAVSWRERMVGGTTLMDTGQLYSGLPFEPHIVEGNQMTKVISSRLNKDGYPLAKTLVKGGWVFAKNVHTHPSGRFTYGMAFPKSEGGGKVYIPFEYGVYIPPRDFTRIDEAGQVDLLNIIEDWIEQQKQRVGFTIVDASHTQG